MKLNCDLGEGLDKIDAALMPHIDMASIACGGHTGDESSMTRAVELALSHQVTIGAHPSYADHTNFGRKSPNLEKLDASHLFDSLCEQVSQLQIIAKRTFTKLSYIKPHGALYNDAWHNSKIQDVLYQLAQQFSLPLVLQAPVVIADEPNTSHAHAASATSTITIINEAFADRAYTDTGSLVSRKLKHATHSDIEKTITQALNIQMRNGLYSENKLWLQLSAVTLCIHSDSPNAVASTIAIKRALDKNSDAHSQ